MPMNEIATIMDETTNPMPTDAAKRGAVAIKSLIGIFALTEMVCFGISLALHRKMELSKTKIHPAGAENTPHASLSKGITIIDSIEIVLTVIDFGLSCGVGYGMYSPMDASSSMKNTEYGKLIEKTSKACGHYTHLWYLKTAFSVVFPGIISVILTSLESKTTKFEKANQIFGYVTGFISSIFALVSAGLEITAFVESCQVKSDSLTEQQKADKSAFQAETMGFILDDIRTVIDAIATNIPLSNIPVFVVMLTLRESFALGYACCMFAEAGIIDNVRLS